jgi:hypothetical protein
MSERPRVTREEAIQRAGEVLADEAIACLQMTPREQAEAAWTPTSPYSVAELEELIRAERGHPPLERKSEEVGGGAGEVRRVDGT